MEGELKYAPTPALCDPNASHAHPAWPCSLVRQYWNYRIQLEKPYS